uniref:MIP09535p n=1 Tax=Drosophila melanogaster TaxID=7227 RepID=C0PVA8_DROME|nr:MIP09535p [Drosophila melanogaster]
MFIPKPHTQTHIRKRVKEPRAKAFGIDIEQSAVGKKQRNEKNLVGGGGREKAPLQKAAKSQGQLSACKNLQSKSARL